MLNRPKWWFVAHIAGGTLSIVISLLLVSGGRPPERPLQWMRLNLLILMITIFLAKALPHRKTESVPTPCSRDRSHLQRQAIDVRSSTPRLNQIHRLLYNPAVNDLSPTSNALPDSARIELAPGVYVPSDLLRVHYAQQRAGWAKCQQGQQHQGRTLDWHIRHHRPLSRARLNRLRRIAGKRVTRDGYIHIVAQTERSQERNRQAVLDRLGLMIQEAMIEPSPRRATKPSSRQQRRRRLDASVSAVRPNRAEEAH